MSRPFLMLLIAAGLAGCRRHAIQSSPFGGCSVDDPPFGPPGRASPAPAARADTGLIERHTAALIVVVRWSVDSLAAESSPPSFLMLRAQGENWRLVRSEDSASTHQIVFRAELPAAEYEARIMTIGAMPVRTSLTLRQGYRDSLMVRVQPKGLTICS